MSNLSLNSSFSNISEYSITFDKSADSVLVKSSVQILSASSGYIQDNEIHLSPVINISFGLKNKDGNLEIYYFDTERQLIHFENLPLFAQSSLSVFSELEEIPPNPVSVEVSSSTVVTTTNVSSNWYNSISGGTSGTGLTCFAADKINHATNFSNNNPSVTTLPSGWNIIAYEDRDKDGNSKISLATFRSSQPYNSFYYRKESFGTLLNDINLTTYGSGTFEITDDIVIPTTNGIPTTDKYIAFLNGPLKGGPFFKINQVERVVIPGGYKLVLNFTLGSRDAVFTDTNDATDIAYIITNNTLTIPSYLSTLTLPPHLDSDGNQVPVSHPCVTTLKNNLSFGGEQFIYITYQAYVEGTWNIYLRQIRFSDNAASDPQYLYPFEFAGVQHTLIPVGSATYYYKVNSIYNDGSKYCVLFDLYLNDGRQIKNCNPNASAYPVFYGMNSSSTSARAEFTLSISCQGSIPGWAVGDTVTNPTTGLTPACYTLSTRPSSTTNWCIYSTNCTQYGLFDDPYCPNPYVTLNYSAIDFYTLTDGDQVVSRVLYNISLSGVSYTPIVEKDESGYNATFLNKAEILITYNGDLSDNWETSPASFNFTDNIPELTGSTKGLTSLPFSIYSSTFYGIQPVHLVGRPNYWVFFNDSGDLTYFYPYYGIPSSEYAEPFLLAENGIKPKICANDRNQIFIAYENLSSGKPQISLIGSGDFSQNSSTILTKRQTRFLTEEDFVFTCDLSSINLDQLPDIVSFDNTIHLVWQSSRDSYWEIYYANGIDYFNPVRITAFDSRSGYPSICADKDGNLFIVFHDNRFDNYEIFLAYKILSDLPNVSRWHSSAFSYADTRITDTRLNSQRPSIQHQPYDSHTIIAFEYEDTQPIIKYALYNNAISASGSRSFYDYDPKLPGRNCNLTVDLLGRPAVVDELIDTPETTDNLPTKSIYHKVCDFLNHSEEQITPNNVVEIGEDPYMDSRLIRRIMIKKEDVEYFTYNISQIPVPVVSKCKVNIEIHGTPEVQAYRIRNENNITFTDWTHWNPKVDSFVMETEWKLSGGSGIKEICVQLQTYSGRTTEYCLPVIADYDQIIYDIKMHKKENVLPKYEGFYVASTSLEKDGYLASTETITVDIYPNKKFDPTIQPTVYFDVIQQGLNDLINLPAQYVTDTLGRGIYRGYFTISREDHKLNVDGLARIKVYFPDTCEFEGATTQLTYFLKDIYNQLSSEAVKDYTVEYADPLLNYRQTPSGKVGTTVTVRPEDPYLIFGDPDYFLWTQDIPQQGASLLNE